MNKLIQTKKKNKQQPSNDIGSGDFVSSSIWIRNIIINPVIGQASRLEQ